MYAVQYKIIKCPKTRTFFVHSLVKCKQKNTTHSFYDVIHSPPFVM